MREFDLLNVNNNNKEKRKENINFKIRIEIYACTNLMNKKLLFIYFLIVTFFKRKLQLTLTNSPYKRIRIFYYFEQKSIKDLNIWQKINKLMNLVECILIYFL